MKMERSGEHRFRAEVVSDCLLHSFVLCLLRKSPSMAQEVPRSPDDFVCRCRKNAILMRLSQILYTSYSVCSSLSSHLKSSHQDIALLASSCSQATACRMVLSDVFLKQPNHSVVVSEASETPRIGLAPEIPTQVFGPDGP